MPLTRDLMRESTGPGQPAARPVRATQNLIAHMNFCWRHPSLTAMEVAWRWLFGLPFLLILQSQLQALLLRIPTDSAGLNHLSFQNPWSSTSLLANAAATYRPAVAQVLVWLVPAGIVAWAVISGIGRTLLLQRLTRLSQNSPGKPEANWLSRTPAVILLQALWITAQLAFFYLWSASVNWAAANHLDSATNPDLLGYLLWLIFFSLGLFTAWALSSWLIAIAPIVLLTQNLSIQTALARSFHLGRTLSSKLVEVNLVMAIIRIAIIILAMVFSAAPLPFADQFSPAAFHVLNAIIAITYLVANDFFQTVRLKSFQELNRTFGTS